MPLIVLLSLVTLVTGEVPVTEHRELNVARGEEIHFMSPDYPEPLPMGTRIVWNIISDPGTQIRLQCTDIRITPSENCEDGYFGIFDGVQEEKYCDTASGLLARSVDNMMVVDFDVHWAGGIFDCTIRADELDIGQVMNAEHIIHLEPTDPAYVEIVFTEIQPNTNLKWSFKTSEPNRIGFYCMKYNLGKCDEEVTFFNVNDGSREEKLCDEGEYKATISTGNTMDINLQSANNVFNYHARCMVQAITGNNAMEFKNIASEEVDSSEYGVGRGPRNTSCKCGWSTLSRSRIVNGDDARDGQYPWMVSLNYLDGHNCGGAIITEYHALTAVHCVDGKLTSDFKLYLGIIDKHNAKHGQIVPLRNIIMHPNYTTEKHRNDIAILVAAEKIHFTAKIGPICLTSNLERPTRQYVTAMGWGNLGEGKNWGPEILKKVHLRVVEHTACAFIRNDEQFKSSPHTICTWSANKNVCHGDSGGPIVWLDPETNRYTLLGLTSTGGACRRHAFDPSMHAFVPYLYDWIQKTIKETMPEANVCHKD